MTSHELKIYPEYFDAVDVGIKKFEVRKNDRQFDVGDCVLLREWDGADYTGREVMGRITYILPADEFPEGIKEGFVVLGFHVLWTDWRVDE